MKALASEITSNFNKRLSKLGLKVRELTGDTTLTKREISETQVRYRIFIIDRFSLKFSILLKKFNMSSFDCFIVLFSYEIFIFRC